MKFVCKNCNYRFESEMNQRGKKCQYCGKEQIIREPDAEDLLKEVNESE